MSIVKSATTFEWRSTPGLCGVIVTGLLSPTALKTDLTMKENFAAINPTLKAAQLNIDESRAADSSAADGVQVARNQRVWPPLSRVLESSGIRYLHERDHPGCELRRDGAKATDIAEFAYLDQGRDPVFNLQRAFAQVLQAKVVLQNTEGCLDCWHQPASFCERRRATQRK